MDTARARKLLQSFDLSNLFIEELGWDHHTATLKALVQGSQIELVAIAQKRGMVVYECPTPKGRSLPTYAERRKIEHQVTRATREHLIVFTDAPNGTQIWQWVKREPGKPLACREHTYNTSQPGDALLQKLEAIAFTLDEEEHISLTNVTRRARTGFDVERITKRFYEEFQNEHKAFLKFIDGIAEVADREWYASVTLNRLMFVYFIQRKGFLDGDRDYLRNRLARMRAEHGKDRFYTFYRYFLLRLFHEGLGSRERTPTLEKLVGRIPYLNGGLFDIHELERPERYGKTIQIPDEAFERVFHYFDQYQWHLDERPLQADNEINPDVLGYIFEKYVNQKQMGAYYTKEDITEYIGKNTVLPFLFQAAQVECAKFFKGPSEPTVWKLLNNYPERYIYPSVRRGLHEPVRPHVAADAEATTLKYPATEEYTAWQQPAPPEVALPNESWRDVMTRRKRYEYLVTKLALGEVRDVRDVIFLNLDFRQFAQDVIENSESPDLLRALWHSVEQVTILDPTCGSGAFLFAALNVLEPLYEACLDRMQAFVDDLSRSADERGLDRYDDFRKVLQDVASHPNRRYFIFKSIILNNLFGVDIMAEAVEICKLRLFLKLAAQVEPDHGAENFGIEPLPDIDFNIRVGNSLVGYSTFQEAKQAITSKLDLDSTLTKIAAKAAALQETFDIFRHRQTVGASSASTEHKVDLRRKLVALEIELNRHLALEYGVDVDDAKAYVKWINSHQPFHWFIEFYRIMSEGGFDVIIGNPPYVEVPKNLSRPLLRSVFRTALDRWSRDEDLYTFVVERSLSLLKPSAGQFGMILPLSVSFSTKRSFVMLRQVLTAELGVWTFSHFDRIPSALFGNEVRTRCTIALLCRSPLATDSQFATTSLLRWSADYREHLFKNLHFASLHLDITDGVPKVASQLEADVLGDLIALNAPLAMDIGRPISFNELVAVAPRFPQPAVYIGGTAYNWFPAWRDVPETTNSAGAASLPARTAGYRYSTEDDANAVFALLCSSIGYWWWAVASDGFNLKKWLVERLPISISALSPRNRRTLASLGRILRDELKRHYVFKDNKGHIGNFYLPACREQILAIDNFLGSAVPSLSPEFFDDIRNFNASFSRAEIAFDGDAPDE